MSETDLKRQFLQAISDELASMDLGGLNEDEMAILLTWSWDDIAAFGRNVLFAQADTALFFGTFSGDGDKSNAFKHAYLAAMHYYSFGANRAWQLLNAHESYKCGQQGLSCLDQMDCLNNGAGIAIASSQPNIVNAITAILIAANTGALTTCF